MTDRRLPMRLFGVHPAQVARSLAAVRRAYAIREEQLAAELAEVQRRIREAQKQVEALRRRCQELAAARDRLAAAAGRVRDAMPLLLDWAEERRRAWAQQAEQERAALQAEAARLARGAAEEQDRFQAVLERLRALALGLVPPDGALEPAGWPSAGEPPQAAGWTQTAGGPVGDTDGWRPGLVEASEPAPAEPAAPGDPAPAEPAAAAPAPSLSDAAALALRVRADLWQLLEGKVVGADLYTPAGELLARAGTPITPALVDRARAAGVLADLILDMTFPPGE